MFATLADFDKFQKFRGRALHTIEQDFPYVEYSLNNSDNILANNIKAKSIELLSEMLHPSSRPFVYEILTPTEDVRLFLVFSHLYDDSFQTLSIEGYEEETKNGERNRIKIAQTIKMFLMQQQQHEKEVFFYSYKEENSLLYNEIKKVTKEITLLEGPPFFEKVLKCQFVENRKEKFSRIFKTIAVHGIAAFLLFVLFYNAFSLIRENFEQEVGDLKEINTSLDREHKTLKDELESLKKKFTDQKIYCLKDIK